MILQRLRRAAAALVLLASGAVAQNTAIYPGASATNKDLLVATNNATTTTTAPVGSGDTTISVASTTSFVSGLSVTLADAIVIDTEVIRVCGSTSTTFTVCSGGRGFDGTTAVTHASGAAVSGFVVAWHHNQLAAEVLALEANAVHSPSPLTSGQLLKGGGGLLAVLGDLSGDCSTSGAMVVTCTKVNGVAYGTSPATNTVPVVTGTNQITYETIPLAALPNGGGFTLITSAPLSGGGSFGLGSLITISCPTCIKSGLALTSGMLIAGAGSVNVQNIDLVGDVTTGGSNATTVVKVNGVTYGASPSTNTVPVVTSSGVVTYEAVPNSALANPSLTVTAGAGLGGGGSVALGSSVTLTLTEAVNSQTGTTYTVAATDCGKLVTIANGSAIAVTLPQAGSGGNFANGCVIDFQNTGAGTVTITPTTSTLDGAASIALTQGQGLRIASSGSNYFTQRGISSSTGFTPTIYGGSAVGSTLSLAGTSSGSPSSAYLYLQSNGQNTLVGCTGSPRSILEIRVTTSCTATASGLDSQFYIGGANSTQTGITLDAVAGFTRVMGARANGTRASTTALASGDAIMALQAWGQITTAGSYNIATSILSSAAQNWTNSNNGSKITMYTVPNGTTSLTQVLQLNQDGAVQFGSSADVAVSRGAAGELDIGTGAAGAVDGKVKSAVADMGTGYRVAGAASRGNRLVGDGTNFTSEQANVINSGSYTFSQQPGGSLTGGSPATVTLTPCPYGVAGSDTNHYVYISGGTGTAEAKAITSGTCTSGATTGTIVFTPTNNHSGAWTVSSASGGVQEAVNHSCNGSGNPMVQVPSGTIAVYGPIYISCNTTLRGTGMFKTALQAQGAAIGIIDAVNKITIEDIGLTATAQQTVGGYGIRLGNTTENSFSRINRIYCEPLYDCVVAVNASQWTFTNSVVYNFSHTMVTAADAGALDNDGPWITNDVGFNYLLASPAEACLYATSTGTITFTAVNCVGNAAGQLTNGIHVVNNPSTGIMIGLSEFETMTTGIWIEGNYNLETISGNFFALPNDGVTGRYGIRLTDGSSSGSNRGNITGNVFQGPLAATAYKAISIEGSAFNWMVGSNSFYNAATAINSTTSGSVTIGQQDFNTMGSTPLVGSATTVFSLTAPLTYAQLPTAADGSFLVVTNANSTCTAGASTGTTCVHVSGAWTH